MILYKYMHPKRIEVLQNEKILFTQPAAFNDPFEARPHISQLVDPDIIENSSIDEVAKRLHYVIERNVLPARQKHLHEHWTTRVGILSLAEERDNLLMWSHYTNAYQGFVIGLDTDHPDFTPVKGDYSGLRKVEYVEDRPSGKQSGHSGNDIYCKKSVAWEYEQEWRIIRRLDASEDQKEEVPSLGRLFELPVSVVCQVIIGCRMTEKCREEIRQLLRKSDRYQHIELFEAKINEKRFKLDIEPLDLSADPQSG